MGAALALVIGVVSGRDSQLDEKRWAGGRQIGSKTERDTTKEECDQPVDPVELSDDALDLFGAQDDG